MRRILVDHAPRKPATKRDNVRQHVDLDQLAVGGTDTRIDLIALDTALEQLAVVAPQPAKVLRCFGSLSIDESAAFLEIAPATVKRHWAFARAWLYRALSPCSAIDSR